jgi:hypothetical protein
MKAKSKATTTIKDCQFYGVKWDSTAVEVVQTVADGLLANAKALDKLIDVFKAQHVQIECLIKVQGD